MQKLAGKKVFIEPMSEHSTARTCADCLTDYQNVSIVKAQPATHWRYTGDNRGAKDQTSRTPVCERHSKRTA